MIDWNAVDKASEGGWITLAELLFGRAQTLLGVQAPDRAGLQSVQADIQEMVAKANLSCPRSVIEAARRTNDQVHAALSALNIADLERRGDRLDAVKARMSSAANELRAQAATLRLAGVQSFLTSVTGIAGELATLKAEVKSLKKDEIPDRIGALATRLGELVAGLHSELGKG